ncbi:MAG: carbohydrate ABC transporter permease [Spirochaetales bacterium]|jgi:putative aldouronate transport system permease protein|nr:carbohydrate ABC transporter permease [Spirochaetales bacterium]
MKAIRDTLSDKTFRTFIYILITVVVAVMLYPFIYVVSTSVSDTDAVIRGEVTLLPIRPLTLDSYKTMLGYPTVGRAYANTVLYAVTGTLLTLILTAITAFPLAVAKFRSQKYFVIYFIVTMFFHGGMIPTFLVIKNLGMIDSIWAMILPTALTAWNLMIFRAFYMGIPPSLHESAYMDGAHDWFVLFRIIIPLSKPVIATIALFTVVRHWNAFFSALLYLNSASKYPVQMILQNILTGAQSLQLQQDGSNAEFLENVSTESLKTASIMVVTAPVIAIYPFVQKYFVKGVMIGSVKG